MTTKKEPSEYTVEEKLQALYQLQTILSEIDKIKTIRGELPLEVQDLEDEIAGLVTRVEKNRVEIAELTKALAAHKNNVLVRKSNIAKYEDDQQRVSSNREFDGLKKEIEFNLLDIELSEKKIKEINAELEQKKIDVERYNEQIENNKQDLELKKSELDEIIEETRQEEEKLRDRAKSIEMTIEPRLLISFKRIRKNSRNGLGIVYVQRESCGGCFNKIPPQRQLDIRMRKKIIVCEYCGRIMIDPELAGVQDNATPVAATPKKRTRKKAADTELS